MLPAYRGADPIGVQLERGESRPGVTLHLLAPGFDQGDVLAQERLDSATPPRNRNDFETRSAALGARLFCAILHDRDDIFQPVPQACLSTAIPMDRLTQ